MKSPPDLPAEFLKRMARLLGDKYDTFAASYRNPPQSGLRVNTLKVGASDFARRSPFALAPMGAWEPTGFRLVDDSQPGAHPYHAAGLYYLQEPSAMAVAALADPRPGEAVLDLAAAPGGKATHLCTRMNDEGLLVANDVHTGRARILAENLERWGARHALLSNAQPEQLAALWGAIFDRVLVDAPCSGEGMSRRSGGHAWSEAMVAACAARQSHILDTAASLVRPGGRLVYATCTFAPEENEAVIARFLAEHEEFNLVNVTKAAGWDQGRSDWLPEDIPTTDLWRAVRIWPHRFPADHPDVAAYLAGYELPDRGRNGWVLFTVDGFNLGWGKRVNGRLKNHYPRGLRRPL